MDNEKWMPNELCGASNVRQQPRMMEAPENAISEAEDESGMATLDEERADIDRSFREFKPMDCVPVDQNTVFCQPLKWRRIVNSEGAVPRPRHGHRATAVHDNIVVWGGGNEGIIEDISLYNISINRWSAPLCRGDVPPGAAAGGLVKGYGAHLYIFGGMLEYSNDVYELDLVRWEWKKLRVRGRTSASVPCPRIGHSLVCDNNGILYVFGGLTNSSDDLRYNKPKYLNDLYTLNTQKNLNDLFWDTPLVSGEPPAARESHSAIMYEQNGRREMIVYGGMNGNRLGDVHVLDLDQMEWRHQYCFGTPPLPRSLHTANLVQHKMFVYGGWVPMEPSDEESHHDLKWKCTSSLGVLNLENFTWEQPGTDFSEPDVSVETFPRARSGHSAVYSGGRIYVWSGRDGYRKAWNNQDDFEVCCRDFWYLETEKPYKPPRVFLGKATLNSLEISWGATRNSEAYLIQIGKYLGPSAPYTKVGESKPILHVVKTPNQGNVVHVVKGPAATPGTKTIIVSKGPNGEPQQKMIVLSPTTATTSSTAETDVPASTLPQPDEQLPENFMEDAPEDKVTIKDELESQPQTTEKNALEQPRQPAGESQQEEAEQNDDTEWYDVAVVKGNTHHITQFFLPGEGPRMAANYDRSYEINDWMNDPRKTQELSHGTNYKIRVAGLNLLGKGEWSQTVVFKTAMPGFPGAPSQIKIQKVQEGANVTWEPPQQTNGIISEYSVYLAIKSADSERGKVINKPMTGVEFLRVYAGPHNECYIPQQVVADAHIEIGPKNKPAIIFRIAAKNEKGYGPATQVRWLQDIQREAQHIHPEGHQLPPVQQQYIRPQASNIRPLQARPTPNNIVRGQVVRQVPGRPLGVYQAAQPQQLAGQPQYRYAPYQKNQGMAAPTTRIVHPHAAPPQPTPVVVRPMPPHRQMPPNNNNNNNNNNNAS